MEQGTSDRLGAATGITATLAVGVSVLYASVAGDAGFAPSSPPLWWSAYAVYLVAVAVDMELVHRPSWATPARVVAVEVVAGSAVFLLGPSLGWTAILLVVTAATAAYELAARTTWAITILQTVVVAVGMLGTDASGFQVVLSTVVYLSFMAFAVVVVGSERRAIDARAELAATHAELRAATALLEASTRDAERLRIARDLHDVVGHQLTALALELEVASHQAEPPAAQHVGRAREIAKDLLGDVRATVGELRAPTEGLATALHQILGDLPGIEVELEVVQDVPLDRPRSVAVVRCVQEVVTNTLRHADAARLWVTVHASAEGVRVDARDDGRGAKVLVPGNGLTGMRERFEQLGGGLRIEAAAGAGFHLVAEAPA